MYKQTIYGIISPLISIVMEVFTVLLYASGLEAVYKTSHGTFGFYVVTTGLFLFVTINIFIATITKYEYAILDHELILRKFVNDKPKKIYSVKLVRSNCIYYNNGINYFSPIVKNTRWMYLWMFGMFKRKCAIVFVDQDGVRTKLIFRPDPELDAEIYRIKTTQW